MLCLKNLSTPSRYSPTAPVTGTFNDERQRHAFQRWLSGPPVNAPSAPGAQPRSPGAQHALALELAPYQTRLAQLGQFTQNRLTLRLTNGPLAGLEICASALGCVLHLQIRTAHRARFEQIVGNCGALESELARLFNRSVTVEMGDATTATE